MSESAEPRRQRKHDRQKQQLLAAASRLFAEKGYSSVTVRRIAEAVDVSPATFYNYFGDKTDVLIHLCDETFEQLELALDEAGREAADAVDVLLRSSRAFCEFAVAHPHHFKVFLMAATDFGDRKAVDFVGARGMASFLRLRAVYEAAGFPVEKPHGSFIWWNGLKGIVDFINLHREQPWFDAGRLIEVSLETLLKGHRG